MAHISESGRTAKTKAPENPGAPFLEIIDSTQILDDWGSCMNDDPKSSFFIAAEQWISIKTLL